MDISEILASTNVKAGARVDLSGWLVDTNDGLCMLGDHYPENYSYPCRIRIINGNIIYPILEEVPSLGGGWSVLFHRVKVRAVVECCHPLNVKAEDLTIEKIRGSGSYFRINIEPKIVAIHVEKKGDYKFDRPRDPMRDWLED